MNILNLNFLNRLQTNNKISTKVINPINFKAEAKVDTFESSKDEDYKKALEYLNYIKTVLSPKYINMPKPKFFKSSEEEGYKKTLKYIDFVENNPILMQNYRREIVKLIKTIQKNPQVAFLYNPNNSQDKKEKELALLNNSLIMFDEKSKSNMQPCLKRFIEENCTEIYDYLDWKQYYILPCEIQQLINGKDELTICLNTDFRKDELYQLIPDTQVQEIKGAHRTTLYVLKFKSSDDRDIYINEKNGKFELRYALELFGYHGHKYPNLELLPITCKKYATEDGILAQDFFSVDMNNPDNQKVLDSTPEYRDFLTTLPFEFSKGIYNGKTYSYIDMTNPKNKELLDSTSDIKVKKSIYQHDISLLINHPSSYSYIPVETLINCGYGNGNILSKLAKDKKIEVKTIKENDKKKYLIKVDRQSWDILKRLKDKNPNIYKFNDYAKKLGITISKLKEAVYSREFEIIPEALTPTEKEIIYINANTSKNREFVQKLQFEQELKKRELEQQKEICKQKRIEQQDLNARLNGVRMSIVWNFMPNTKDIASKLATKDGHVSKLLIKEDDPEQELTQKEKVVVNKYRKEVWFNAGVEELKKAHQKANEIMYIYHTQGIDAIDEEYKKIFTEYGFC